MVTLIVIHICHLNSVSMENIIMECNTVCNTTSSLLERTVSNVEVRRWRHNSKQTIKKLMRMSTSNLFEGHKFAAPA